MNTTTPESGIFQTRGMKMTSREVADHLTAVTGRTVSPANARLIESQALRKLVKGLQNDPLIRALYADMTGAEPPRQDRADIAGAMAKFHNARKGRTESGL